MKASTLGLLMLGVMLALAALTPDAMWTGGSLIPKAYAVIGRPLTPVSAAGVARRTTRRVVATSTYVAALPPSCTVVIVEGNTLQKCGGTYYQTSGSQYVVVRVEN